MKLSAFFVKILLILIIASISLSFVSCTPNAGGENPPANPGGSGEGGGEVNGENGGESGGESGGENGGVTNLTNNFVSRETATFDNINGKTVTVDTFMRRPNDSLYNPNVGQGIMLYQCIKYKEAHPEEDVYITLTSFHLSVVAAVCLDRESDEFGLMKSLYDEEYDDKGYYRIAYLLVLAAKRGINVTVVGHIDGSAVLAADGNMRPDYSFIDYFDSHLDDSADIEGKKVGDFLLAKKAYWTSYGDKAASDMMHVKSCTVSNYIDKDGKECGPAVWLGSTNVDGINCYGHNGNNSLQTGIIITNHEQIRRAIYNYTLLMTDYCSQEGIAEFRTLIRAMNKEQTDLILEGRASEIPENERIIYLGTENDNVFEFYLTPLGGSIGAWDTTYNPYSKYISKLLPATSGASSIVFAWNNAKYYMNFEFSLTLFNILKNAFQNSANCDNRLYLHLPGADYSYFDNLTVGENIGYKKTDIDAGQYYYHNKDFQLSYVENGTRYYVSVLNSLNFHQGAMNYQANSILIIKETEKTGNNVYVAIGKDITAGCISEADRISAK